MKRYLLGALAVFVLLFPAAGTAAEVLPRLSLALSEEYNDNVFLRKTDRESDFITRIIPRLDLGLRAPKAALTLGYSPSFNIYSSHNERNSTSQRFNARGSLLPSERLSLSLETVLLKSEEAAEQREALTTDLGALRENRELTTTTVSGLITYRLSPALAPTLGAFYTRTDYQAGIIEDSETYAGTFSLDYTLSERTTLSADAKYTLFDYKGAANATSQDYTIRISYKLTPSLSANAFGGITITELDVIDKRSEDFSGGVSLTQRTERGTVTLSFKQTVISSVREAEPQQSRTYGVHMTRKLAELWNTSASLSYNTYKSVASSFRGVSRDTEQVRAGGDISYRIRPWAQASLSYRYIHSNEKGDSPAQGTGDYYNHIVLLSLSFIYDKSLPY